MHISIMMPQIEIILFLFYKISDLNPSQNFVLLSENNTYYVEYLIGHLVLANSITEAVIFDSQAQAIKFQKYLYKHCSIQFSVNTFIQ